MTEFSLNFKDPDEVKDWLLFHHRLKDIGINKLSQEKFINKIREVSWPHTFNFYLGQPKNPTIFIGEKIVIADIRHNANVKRDFRPKDLKELGQKNNFEYIYYNKLGSPFHKRQKQENISSQEAKEVYQSYVLGNTEAKAQFMKLYQELYHHQFIILICYCQVERPIDPEIPGECHRFWLIDLLMKQKREDLQKKREINAKFETQEIITEVL